MMLAPLFLYALFISIACRGQVQAEQYFIDPNSTCKAATGKPNWPAEQDWSELNRLVAGKLLKPVPAAAPCHRNTPAYNAAKCETILGNWKSPEFHSHHPTSTLWSNVNGYSCPTEGRTTCEGHGFPVYVVNASSAQQIGTAIKWSKDRNVRINVIIN